eukprot:767637-Hanusia_phi.AAC.3
MKFRRHAYMESENAEEVSGRLQSYSPSDPLAWPGNRPVLQLSIMLQVSATLSASLLYQSNKLATLDSPFSAILSLFAHARLILAFMFSPRLLKGQRDHNWARASPGKPNYVGPAWSITGRRELLVLEIIKAGIVDA